MTARTGERKGARDRVGTRFFLDTNIPVYALDAHDPQRQRIARDLLRASAVDGAGAISTQVLQEFYVVATRKLGVVPVVAKGLVAGLQNLQVVTVVPDLIREAIDCSILNQLAFWDALIVVCAEAARCELLLTEDLNHGQVIRGVRVENPFLSVPGGGGTEG